MKHLSRSDYAGALAPLARIEASVVSVESFAHETVAAVGAFAAAQRTTLSVRDLVTGLRGGIGLPRERWSCEDIASFDRHRRVDSVVRHHGLARLGDTARLSELLDGRVLRRCVPYADYDGQVGLEYVISVPLWMDGRTLIAIALNRRHLDFSERERERLELLRPHLAHLYRQACRADSAGRDGGQPPLGSALLEREPESLTPRERNVMHWLAAGKTDVEIAALLSLSPRTVSKHLEHIYVKLGVETRTAAVMRVLAMRAPRSLVRAAPYFAEGSDVSSRGAAPIASRTSHWRVRPVR
jgi:DNA-binding CsgD family transcriptional regulator